ncbi:uncharacterized protein [Amphiura filiformis]|uniref:uncharacterized protein n=1 Tax=Amphiura filiformis TaxID=82378 RepID=UPI003B21F4E8
MSVIKKAKQRKADFFNHGAKLLCLCLLLGQMLGLDYLIIERDVTTKFTTRYIWVILDFLVLTLWFAILLWSYILDRREKKATTMEGQKATAIEEHEPEVDDSDSKPSKNKMSPKYLLRPLPLTPLIWLVYSLVLVAKVTHMFSTFALSLPSGEHLISSTFLKISLAKTAFILTLLIYAVKSHVTDDEKQTLITDKLGNAATLDVLDSIMLLDMLFSIDNPLSTSIYHGIRIFACICLVLPVVPLLSMVFLAECENKKAFHLNLIVNTVFRLVMGNIPHLAFRLHLWHSHKVDVSTFLIKNLIVVFVGVMDIIKHTRHYKKETMKRPYQEPSDDPANDITLSIVCDA